MNYIQTYNIDSKETIETVSDFLYNKESYILNNYPYLGNFGTKLKLDNVSTRAGGYNIFQMVDECPQLNELLTFIKTSYLHYIDNILPNKTFTNTDIDPALSCWVNVLRKSESIGMHKHAEDYGDLWSFISGTLVLNATNTNTYYYSNDRTTAIENINGQLTLFPPFYSHWTDIQTEDVPRVTLGLDVLFKKDHANGDSRFKDNLIKLPI